MFGTTVKISSEDSALDSPAMLRGPLDIYKGYKFNDKAREIASGPPQIASGSHHNNSIIEHKILLQLEIRGTRK